MCNYFISLADPAGQAAHPCQGEDLVQAGPALAVLPGTRAETRLAVGMACLVAASQQKEGSLMEDLEKADLVPVESRLVAETLVAYLVAAVESWMGGLVACLVYR